MIPLQAAAGECLRASPRGGSHGGNEAVHGVSPGASPLSDVDLFFDRRQFADQRDYFFFSDRHGLNGAVSPQLIDKDTIARQFMGLIPNAQPGRFPIGVGDYSSVIIRLGLV